MKQKLLLFCILAVSLFSKAQNVGIGTITPQATLDVKGNHRFGGTSTYMSFDTLSGKMIWGNSYLFAPVSQTLMKHSAAADGLFYNNTAPVSGQLEYRNAAGNPVFYTNFINGNGYFSGNVGIGATTPQAKLHIISTGNEVARLDADEPFLSLYSNGVYKGYFWKSPNSIEIGSASGSGLPVTLAPDGYQRVFVTPAGNVGIGTGSPLARLHVEDSSILFSAAGDIPATPGNTPISGAGRRMMWYPDKAAFRAGYVFAANWDKDNVGEYSIAMGFDTKASGDYSTAMGAGTIASGYASAAMGNYNIASGSTSIAMGNSNVASGENSTAMGSSNAASGTNSTAMGYYTIASGYFSTAMGELSDATGIASTAMGLSTTASGAISTAMGIETTASGDGSTALGSNTIAKAVGSLSAGIYNDDTDSPNPITAAPTDRIFQIGNGTSSVRSNALTVLRNGNTGIGVLVPDYKLDVGARMRIRSTVGNTAGIWLNNDANNATPAFIGMRSDNLVGFYGNGAPNSGWGFLMNTTNGRIGIGTDNPTQALHVVGNICATGTIGACSDVRYKKDFTPVSHALHSVLSLNGFYYRWRKEEYPRMQFTSSRQLGFSAQEVEKLFPEIVMTDAKGYKSVDYARLAPVLVEAIKEQQKQIDELQRSIEQLLKNKQ